VYFLLSGKDKFLIERKKVKINRINQEMESASKVQSAPDSFEALLDKLE